MGQGGSIADLPLTTAGPQPQKVRVQENGKKWVSEAKNDRISETVGPRAKRTKILIAMGTAG